MEANRIHNDLIEFVANHVGHYPNAWDMVDPKEICAAVLTAHERGDVRIDDTPITYGHGVECPDCGPVTVIVKAWSGQKPISVLCLSCLSNLYVDENINIRTETIK